MRSENFLKTWSRWSGREDLSDELMRLLGTTSQGGAEFAECLVAASRIDIHDDESWYREWTRIADDSHVLAEAAVDRGCAETAKQKWFRAISYYQAAAVPFDNSDERHRAVTVRMRACAQSFLRRRDPQGEVVTIPWRADYPLQGYFLPAPRAAGGAPTVICFSEPGQRKEASLFKLAEHASARGLSLLVVDLLGSGAGDSFEDIVGCRHLESAVGAVMDYVTSRDDVDEDRVAVLADDWGSSFVARAISLDHRYAAAVCDAGLWDACERSFLARRFASGSAAMASCVGASRVARRIQCPVLVAMPERGWLPAKDVKRLVADMKQDRPDITLKLFPGEQGDAESAALANGFIFDWLAARLGQAPRLQS
jgi:dienelactone hydrolase